jgi:hypothetical protein
MVFQKKEVLHVDRKKNIADFQQKIAMAKKLSAIN